MTECGGCGKKTEGSIDFWSYAAHTKDCIYTKNNTWQHGEKFGSLIKDRLKNNGAAIDEKLL